MHWSWGDIRRRCRHYGSLLGLVAVAVLATCGVPGIGEDDVGAVAPAVGLPIVAARVMPAVPAAPRPSITARVVADGAAVADAEVSLDDGTPTPIVARTDRDGVVHFTALEPGPYEVWATHGGLTSAIARVGEAGPDSQVELALVPAATLSGRVIADAALPSAAVMRFVPVDVDHPTRAATLDQEGRFSIAGLPYGHWRIESDVAGFVQTDERVVQLASEQQSVDVKLQKAGGVSGTVVDASGRPVANATIVLRDQAGIQLPQSFAITAAHTRWIHPLASTRYLPANDSTHFGAPRPGVRPAECGRGHCGLDLGNQRGTVVHAVADGTILSLFPEPKTEAGRVVVVQHAGGLKSFYMHLDELRPGLEIGQVIHAGDPVGLLGSTGFTRSVPHLHFAFTYEKLGRTWYLDPEPVIRQAVVLAAPHAYEPVTAPPANRELDSTLGVRAVTTDAQGAFKIDGVGAGSYVAVAFATEFPPGGSAPFAVKSGEDTGGVVVHLDVGAFVDGRVLGRDGPIEGATVIASTGFGESTNKIAMTTTDKHGEFKMSALAGKITLSASAARFGEAEQVLVLDERERTRRHVEFRLTFEDSQLRGQVMAPDGGAPGPVVVRVVDGPTRKSVMTDAQGRFGFGVASGRYVLELSSAEYPTKRVTLDAGRWLDTRLEPGGGLRCFVRDPGGAPLPGVRVEAIGTSGQSVARTSDAKGVVELRGLTAGEWKVSARGTGYVGATKTTQVRVARVLQDIQLELTRGAVLAGVVRDDRGQRVAGARVWLGTATTQTDADGNFRLVDVPTGRGVLEAERDGRHGSVAVQLAPGDERVTISIELSD